MAIRTLCLIVLFTVGWGRAADAQLGLGGEPSMGYYKALARFHEGSFADALEAFENNAKLGTRTVSGRWYDSICYYTMMGECLYALGNLPQALDHYNAALAVLVANPNWLERVQFPVAVGPQAPGKRIVVPWSPADRTSMPGDFSSPMQVLVGRLDNSNVARRGGVIAPPELHSLRVAEVIRCLAVAMQRRIELLGPLCEHDSLSSDLVKALESAGGTRNHWSQPWLDLQYGLALAGLGREGEAAAALERSVFIGGTYTHPGSAIALYELGRLLAGEQRYEQAKTYFLQASVAAAEFEQFFLVERCFAQATAVHSFHNNAEPLAAVGVATDWAQRQRIRHLTASLLSTTADNLLAMGRIADAAPLVADAQRARGRRTGISLQLAARLDIQEALVWFFKGNLQKANASLAKAINSQQVCSPWLFQIGVADSWYSSRADTSSRLAGELFARLLREPTHDDWIRNTLDSLTVQMSPHPVPYEHWLEVCLDRGEIDQAFWVAESLRRHRFYASLPLGGRLLSLRWIMEAPEERLDQVARNRRNDLRARYPQYVDISRQVAQLRKELLGIPWDTEDGEQQKQLRARFDDLERASQQLELMLGEIALRREAIPNVFPPMRTAESLQDMLGPRQAALTYIATTRGYTAFLVSPDGLHFWRLPPNRSWTKWLYALLRSLGLVQPNGSITEKVLEESDWRNDSEQLWTVLVDRSQYNFWKRFDDLFVVPDGLLWYLPFELLPVEAADSAGDGLLGSQTRITYAASAGLIAAAGGPRTRFPKTVVVQGKMSQGEDPEEAAERVAEMQAVVRDLTTLPDKLPTSSGLARCLWDRLVVLDRGGNATETMAWSPVGLDAPRPDATLARWLQLPWGGPAEVILPGFSSAAETSGRGGNGQEIFQAIMGLMASGTRTVLISRWRTGGQTAYDLVREYLQEVDGLTPVEAWQRSRQIVRQQEIVPEWEPRLSTNRRTELLVADHPFFWAGFLLADQGTPAPQPAPN